MTRFAHCNRTFARRLHCNGTVFHALLCVLIAASSVQSAETVLVRLAPRHLDANATRNIPHVCEHNRSSHVSMLKGTCVTQWNSVAVRGDTLHVATALSVHRLPILYLLISLVGFTPFCGVWERVCL